MEPQSCGIGSLPQNFVDYNVCYFDGFHVCNKAWNECGVREAWSTGGRAGWEDLSVEPRSCGSGSLPPSDPFRTCGFDRCPRHRGLQSRLHILSIVFFNLCPLLELGSDKSRLPEEDSGWSVREAKLSRNSVFSMQ